MASNPERRESAAITYREFVEAYQALAFANCLGHVVDTALDVTWSMYGIKAEHDVAETHARLLEKVSQWLEERGLPALYIWTIEVGATFGVHSHITLYLPLAQEAPFRSFLAAALPEPVFDPASAPGALPFKLQVNAGETTYHQWRRFRYMLKSVDPRVDLDGLEALPGRPTLVAQCGIKHCFGGFMRIDRLGVARVLRRDARLSNYANALPPATTTGNDAAPAFDDRYLEWSRDSRSRFNTA